VANRALNAAKGVKRIKKHREDQDAGRIEMDSIGMRLKDQLSKVELHLKTRSGIERAKAYLSKAKACKAILTQVKTLLGEPENLMTDVEAIYLLIRKYNLAQSNEDSSEYSSIKEDKLWPKMVSLCKVSSVKTGIAGKYKIQNLDKDQYYLYALYITNFSLIEWFLPLDKDRGKSIFIDLYNENASQIINKED